MIRLYLSIHPSFHPLGTFTELVLLQESFHT